MPDIAQLVVEITPKGINDAKRQLDDLAKSAALTQKNTTSMMDKFRSLQSVMQGPVAAFREMQHVVGSVINVGKDLVNAYASQELALSNLEAILKSTNGTVGITSLEFQKMAASMQASTLFGDELIIQSQAVMTTFRAIGSDVFPQAIDAAADLSTVLGGDLQSASIMIGKALNEPIQGVQALRRVGVQLTDEQEVMVKQFMAVNDIASAQGVILEELNLEFGGAAKAAGETAAGAFTQLGNAIGDAKESMGQVIAEGLEPMVRWMTDAISKAVSLGASIRNIWYSTSDSQKALEDLEAIVALANKDRAAFEKTYVKGGQLGGLSTDAIIKMYEQRLDIVRLTVEDEKRFAALSKAAADTAAGQPKSDNAWRTKLGEATGVDSFSGGGAGVVDEYIDKLMHGAELSVSFGDDVSGAIEKVRNQVRGLTENLLASGLFTEQDATITRLRDHYAGLGEAANSYAAKNTVATESETGNTAIVVNGLEEEASARYAREIAINAERYALEQKIGDEVFEAEVYADQQREAEKLAAAIGQIGNAFKSAFQDAYIESFKTLGEMMVDGTLNAETFVSALADIGMQLLNALPMLFLQAGLQAIISGNVPLGLALIGASGLSAFAAGAAGATQKSAHGNVFGWEGMQAFAQGGAFTNSVVNRPTMFAYGGGFSGEMGEAGPEAIVPLARMNSGNLGVESVPSRVIVQIIDQTSGGTEKSTEETTGPDGTKMIRVLIRDAVRSAIGSGEADSAMSSRYGVAPIGVRRT